MKNKIHNVDTMKKYFNSLPPVFNHDIKIHSTENDKQSELHKTFLNKCNNEIEEAILGNNKEVTFNFPNGSSIKFTKRNKNSYCSIDK